MECIRIGVIIVFSFSQYRHSIIPKINKYGKDRRFRCTNENNIELIKAPKKGPSNPLNTLYINPRNIISSIIGAKITIIIKTLNNSVELFKILIFLTISCSEYS
jgi:hypothetical protein